MRLSEFFRNERKPLRWKNEYPNRAFHGRGVAIFLVIGMFYMIVMEIFYNQTTSPIFVVSAFLYVSMMNFFRYLVDRIDQHFDDLHARIDRLTGEDNE